MSYLLLVLVSVAGTCVHSAAIDSSGEPVQNVTVASELELTSTPGTFRDCFNEARLVECLRSVAVRHLDKAIESSAPLRVTRFLVIRRNADFIPSAEERVPANDWATIFAKVRDFINSRTFALSLTAPDGRSSLLPAVLPEEGRGKKHKQKHQQGGMYMMGGVAFMAMMAQLVLGKVALLAAVALIMAKIALIFSTLNGFKKAAGGGGGAEHVVYEHGSGGAGGGGGGWQRSIEPKKTDYEGQYDYDDGGPYRRRRPDLDYRDPLDGA